MRTAILLSGMLLLSLYGSAQNPYKVLLDVTGKDTTLHAAVIRHAAGLAKAYPDMEIQVVVYGPAISMVRSGDSRFAKRIEDLTANPKVSFTVCAATMKRLELGKNDIVAGVKVVPDAILEIVSKQREGWGYIKEN